MQDQQLSNDTETIAGRLASVRLRMATACQDSQRADNDVYLLAVSKRHSATMIRQAYEAGQASFGENYAQEAVDKIQQLKDLKATWHFIGKLQSNKLKLLAQYFDWLQTVTSIKHLDLLSQHAQAFSKTLNICIQVKLGDEDNKNGVDVELAMELMAHAHQCAGIRPRGLMAIPPATEDYQQQYEVLQPLREFFVEMQQRWPNLDTLSMGMSNDLEAAIAQGSTMVRVGTAIFGARS
ncbi:MAG: YggS family pyridoxal phosphate-dependent enzyme [Coxiellaceae bacterium]|nr:YggS family pyridoxal phosphate-dependent enzyme [Coxiellaceae bacterium]